MNKKQLQRILSNLKHKLVGSLDISLEEFVGNFEKYALINDSKKDSLFDKRRIEILELENERLGNRIKFINDDHQKNNDNLKANITKLEGNIKLKQEEINSLNISLKKTRAIDISQMKDKDKNSFLELQNARLQNELNHTYVKISALEDEIKRIIKDGLLSDYQKKVIEDYEKCSPFKRYDQSLFDFLNIQINGMREAQNFKEDFKRAKKTMKSLLLSTFMIFNEDLNTFNSVSSFDELITESVNMFSLLIREKSEKYEIQLSELREQLFKISLILRVMFNDNTLCIGTQCNTSMKELPSSEIKNDLNEEYNLKENFDNKNEEEDFDNKSEEEESNDKLQSYVSLPENLTFMEVFRGHANSELPPKAHEIIRFVTSETASYAAYLNKSKLHDIFIESLKTILSDLTLFSDDDLLTKQIENAIKLLIEDRKSLIRSIKEIISNLNLAYSPLSFNESHDNALLYPLSAHINILIGMIEDERKEKRALLNELKSESILRSAIEVENRLLNKRVGDLEEEMHKIEESLSQSNKTIQNKDITISNQALILKKDKESFNQYKMDIEENFKLAENKIKRREEELDNKLKEISYIENLLNELQQSQRNISNIMSLNITYKKDAVYANQIKINNQYETKLKSLNDKIANLNSLAYKVGLTTDNMSSAINFFTNFFKKNNKATDVIENPIYDSIKEAISIKINEMKEMNNNLLSNINKIEENSKNITILMNEVEGKLNSVIKSSSSLNDDSFFSLSERSDYLTKFKNNLSYLLPAYGTIKDDFLISARLNFERFTDNRNVSDFKISNYFKFPIIDAIFPFLSYIEIMKEKDSNYDDIGIISELCQYSTQFFDKTTIEKILNNHKYKSDIKTDIAIASQLSSKALDLFKDSSNLIEVSNKLINNKDFRYSIFVSNSIDSIANLITESYFLKHDEVNQEYTIENGKILELSFSGTSIFTENDFINKLITKRVFVDGKNAEEKITVIKLFITKGEDISLSITKSKAAKIINLKIKIK